MTHSDLSIDLGFCRLKNPVIAASGTFGYGTETSAPFSISTGWEDLW